MGEMSGDEEGELKMPFFLPAKKKLRRLIIIIMIYSFIVHFLTIY